MRPNGNAKLLEERRKQAIELLHTNMKPVEVARQLGVDRRSVRRWKASFLKDGIASLKARPAPGRTPKINNELKAKISKMLMKTPDHYGFKKKVWTYTLIAKAIKRKYGISYHYNYIGPLLRSMGWNLGRVRAVGRRAESFSKLSA
jgi:transposase